jgi:dihydrolipoamide dehydrogenase
MVDKFDLIVIGAGPGGYVAAIRAAQLGMKVACIDKRKTLGGTCLNIGCIPSKALLSSSYKYLETQHHLKDHGIIIEKFKLDLKAMMARKEKIVDGLTQGIAYLFKKNQVTFLQGQAKFLSAKEVEISSEGQSKQYTADSFIIATGSVPLSLSGIEIDEERIVTSTGALSLKEIPNHLVVVGAGYIGLELGSVWKRLGSNVTIIEYFDRILSSMDQDVSTALFKSLEAQGIQFKFSTSLSSATKTAKGLQIKIRSTQNEKDKEEEIVADALLSSAGRKPYTEGLQIDLLGIKCDEKERILVDNNFQTTVKGIYAIGDVIKGPMLAHKAEEEGIAVAEMLAGQKPHINYNALPAIIYTHPEVATVGKTEQELMKENIPYIAGKFPFSANARAKTNGESEGFVKILSHSKTDEILGVHIIHAEAGTMIAEAVVAMEYKASSEDIARICHAHPTVNEAVKEASLSVLKRPIHI